VRVWQRQMGLSGDYNGDQQVDAADYVAWRKSVGQSGIDLPADGSGNGTVDESDYLMWVRNFSAVGGAAGSVAAQVPEPGYSALAAMALLRAVGLRKARSPLPSQARRCHAPYVSKLEGVAARLVGRYCVWSVRTCRNP
jgi:hypothetical protein